MVESTSLIKMACVRMLLSNSNVAATLSYIITEMCLLRWQNYSGFHITEDWALSAVGEMAAEEDEGYEDLVGLENGYAPSEGDGDGIGPVLQVSLFVILVCLKTW